MSDWPARIVDVHSHWGTRRGYPFQTPEELAQQQRVFKAKASKILHAFRDSAERA